MRDSAGCSLRGTGSIRKAAAPCQHLQARVERVGSIGKVSVVLPNAGVFSFGGALGDVHRDFLYKFRVRCGLPAMPLERTAILKRTGVIRVLGIGQEVFQQVDR